MAIACENGAKECCGCGECMGNNRRSPERCSVCGAVVEEEEAYTDMFFEVLCLKCLKNVHKL